MGDDKKERALGKNDAAYMTVVPLWARYMYEAARDYPNLEIPWEVPPRGRTRRIAATTPRARKGPRMDLIYRHAEHPEAPPAADGLIEYAAAASITVRSDSGPG